MQQDTKSLEALLSALNRSAERLQTLWFSFLGLTLYFIITALTTTHRMLLLEEGQSLPIINLKVPLLPFYVIAPLLYVVLHFYFLMMLVLLARSADVFEKAMSATLPVQSDREQFRMRAENALFLQLLIGAREEREGTNGWMLSAIALITLAVGPVLTLVVIQMQFLPYHHQGITWLHRLTIGVDVVLILMLWRGFRHRQGRALPQWPWQAWRGRRPGWAWRAVLLTVGVFACLWLSLWEGRWAGEPWLDPTIGNQRRLLISAGVMSDRLSLPNEMIVGEALLLEKQKEAAAGGGGREVPTRDFRGRNFAHADFSQSDLRDVFFSEDPKSEKSTILHGTKFYGTQLQRANLSWAEMQGAKLVRAQMQGADLSLTQMQGAVLRQAEMQGANLSEAQLQGADLAGAMMQGANLSRAFLFRTVIDTNAETGVWFEALEFGKKHSLPDRNEVIPISEQDVERWLQEATAHLADPYPKSLVVKRLNRLNGEDLAQDSAEVAVWREREKKDRARDPDGQKKRSALADTLGDLACLSEDGAPHVARGLVMTGSALSRLGDQLNSVRHRMRAGRDDPTKCPGIVGFTQTDWRSLYAIQAAR